MEKLIVILKIPEKKFDFFMELIKQLGIEVSSEIEIPEEDKKTVRERIKNSRSEDLMPWEKARKNFKFKA